MDNDNALKFGWLRHWLGPLIFMIYVNDIYNSSDKQRFWLFADDTNLV